MAHPKRKSLSPEDRRLWDQVKATAQPLKKHERVDPSASRPAPKAPLSTPRLPTTPVKVGATPKPERATHDLAPAPEERLAKAPLRMDKKAFDRMKRGRMSPEARLDLHGMTLAAAHPALTRFILSSQAAGKRMVLVITGKGRTGEDDGPIPTRPGILRHQVPHWLQLPPLSAVVLQVKDAHVRHGGSGAYYVMLKRTRPERYKT